MAARPSCGRCGRRPPCCCSVRPCRHTAHLPLIAHIPTTRWFSDEQVGYWRDRLDLGVELGDEVAAFLATGDLFWLAATVNGGIVWNDRARAVADIMMSREPEDGQLLLAFDVPPAVEDITVTEGML